MSRNDRRVGVLGGAFNPPHIAHLLLAQEAIASLGLDELILVPTGQAPHKPIDPEPGRDVRLAMARLAAAGTERLVVSDVEVGRDGPSFAYRTLALLADENPGSQLTFVMGADAAAGLEGWERPERVVDLARVAVAGRPGFDRARVEDGLARLDEDSRVEWLEMPAVDVSSSMIRERVAAGRPIRWLVPDAVAELIAERELYGADRREAPAEAGR